MNQVQQQIINDWINTSNYIYNKTLEKIKNGFEVNFHKLRNLLVTNNTKKNTNEYKYYDDLSIKLKLEKKDINKKLLKNPSSNELLKKLEDKQKEIDIMNKERRDAVKKVKTEKNHEVNNWELKTPKEIRAGAVNDVCKAYKTAFTNLKNNNITYFNLNFRKKLNPNKCILLPKNFIKINKDIIKIAPTFLGNNCEFKINNNRNIEINNDVRLTKQKNKYFLYIPVKINYIENKNKNFLNYCGIDPGIRSFATTFGNNSCIEYKHNKLKLNKLNNQMDLIKSRRKTRKSKKRIRKKAFNKREILKNNLINEVHWKTINNILDNNDLIFYGDIKSHNIVKHAKYRHINRAFNDLKFYIFKERLLYKAATKNKYVFCINEAYTTQTCSICGKLNKPYASEIYNCSNCNINISRDVNAAKNILMKGLIKI